MLPREAPGAEASHAQEKRHSGLTKWMLLIASLCLLVIGISYGKPVDSQGELPPFAVSPIVRRTLADAREDPRFKPQLDSLPVAMGQSELIEANFFSQLLGREMPFAVLLPPGYHESVEPYPVFYALHGVGGYYAEWVDFGVVDIADSLFSNHQVPPFIIAFPQGDQSYWFNHPRGGDPWSDYVVNEFVPLIDSQYRTIHLRTGRAIGGMSMGAVGALQIALRHPDVFSVVGAHSPSFRTEPDNEVFWYFKDIVHYASYDPFVLAKSSAGARGLRIMLDAGDQDVWLPTTDQFHRVLTSLSVPHRYRVEAGAHDLDYWASQLAVYLDFYGYALVGPDVSARVSSTPTTSSQNTP